MSPPQRTSNFPAQRGQPTNWPTEDSYTQVHDGWYASESSQDWLYKPESRMYFHSPTETLWKQAATAYQRAALAGAGQQGATGGGAFVRIDAEKSRAEDSLSIAALCSQGLSRKAFVRTCFNTWRWQTAKFEQMERDLLHDCCEEARMPVRPRTSQPSAQGREGETGEEARGFEQLGQLLSWMQASFSGRAGSKGSAAPAIQALTPGALVKHNLRSVTKEAKQQQAQLCGGAGDARRQPEALAPVHRERPEAWRVLVQEDGLDALASIEQIYNLHEGDEVLFDAGRQSGTIIQVRPDADEFSVSDQQGRLVGGKDGKPRLFKADELVLTSVDPAAWMAVSARSA